MDAQEKLDNFRERTINGDLKNKCVLCKNQHVINKEYMEFKKNSNAVINKQRLYYRLFSNSYTFLTVIEIILSILLVLAVSKASHSGEKAIQSRVFSMCIVMVFAFLKVFLERCFLKPRIEQLGWKMYLKSTEVLRSLTEEFDEQIRLDLNRELKKTS